jgi:hypothetical protein
MIIIGAQFSQINKYMKKLIKLRLHIVLIIRERNREMQYFVIQDN